MGPSFAIQFCRHFMNFKSSVDTKKIFTMSWPRSKCFPCAFSKTLSDWLMFSWNVYSIFVIEMNCSRKYVSKWRISGKKYIATIYIPEISICELIKDSYPLNIRPIKLLLTAWIIRNSSTWFTRISRSSIISHYMLVCRQLLLF